jgi:CIC family chloride channel protein
VIARSSGLSKEQVKALVPVGCSAALAAAFNTPIAAVLFSLEEIMGDLHAAVLGTAVVSSATSWMVLHLVLGDDPLFHVPAYRLVHPAEFAIYAALGVVGGLGSAAFVKLLLGLRNWFKGFPKWSVWFQPVAGGLTVGLLGYFLPDVMGVGYSYVGKILNGDVVLKTVVLLAVLKIVATSVAYASGNAGGIFGPSLFIGATMGAAVGSVAHRLFPAYTAGPGAYALVGMGTAFAGIVRTPLTSVIMIFEVTRDYTIIVPLMISNLIAYLISYAFQRTPIYEALAYQDGVHLPSAKARDQAGRMQVSQAMRPVPAALEEDTDAGGEFKRLADLVAESVTTPPHVHPDHQLSLALERMGAGGLNVLPVISRADVRKLVGIVVLDDVLRAFGVTKPSEARESAGLN